MKKNEIKSKCKFFLVDLNPIDTDDVLDIYIYLIKKNTVWNNAWG